MLCMFGPSEFCAFSSPLPSARPPFPPLVPPSLRVSPLPSARPLFPPLVPSSLRSSPLPSARPLFPPLVPSPLCSSPLPWQLEDGKGTAMLCMLPAKFHRMLWLKRGSFVVADVSAAEEVDKAGGRVRGSITAVLFDHHIKELVASNQWFVQSRFSFHPRRESEAP
ncbi:unnamed protein product [Closterium sp. Yama58-4]|nr:unnamed protein product [Closterium sp. Yama58-4]